MVRAAWLLGHPVSHSVSPTMHNAAYRKMGLDLVYLAADVSPDRLPAAVEGLVALGFAGANVTIPHKEAAARLVGELRGAARVLRAVNTLYLEAGNLVGENTDVEGWLRSWDEQIGEELAGRRVILLGAGGAARGVFWALGSRGAGEILVMNRSHRRAAELVEELSPHYPDTHARAAVLDQDLFLNELGPECVVVNTTPVGMSPHPEASPVEWPRPLPERLIACDLIYNPLSSRFLDLPRRFEHRVMGGLGMLVHQGARAIELWTGRQPPVDVMRKATVDALRARFAG